MKRPHLGDSHFFSLNKSTNEEGCWRRSHLQNKCGRNLENTLVVDKARRPKELLLKEALHIQITPAEEHFNCNRGLRLSDC